MSLSAAVVEALLTVLSWPVVLYIVLGALFGVVMGAVPGLGGVVALTLLIPLTFGMEAVPALVLLTATMGGVAFGGSVSAILVNTPGTPPNAATCFDGYPLSRQGRGAEAITISAIASVIGAMVGLGVFFLLLPTARRLVLSFTPPEFFWLSVLGLATIGIITQEGLVRGLASAGFGLMLSFIGFDTVTGTVRYGFGVNYLWDGIQLVPAFIGLFAVSEGIRLATQDSEIADMESLSLAGSRLRGVVQVVRRPRVLLQSGLIGVCIGIIPGAGGTVANFLSYVVAARTASEGEEFGGGTPSGIIASEAANDAKDGGSLIPTVAFGLPGSAMTAVLLAGFELHGLDTGPELLSSNSFLIFILVFGLLAANIITSVAGIALAPYLSKVTTLPSKLLAPVILVVSLEGVFVLRQSMGDVLVTVLFGFLGYALVRLGYSRIAIALAIILGPLAERYLHITVQISDSGFVYLFQRPLSLAIIAGMVLLLGVPPLVARIRKAWGPDLGDSDEPGQTPPSGPHHTSTDAEGSDSLSGAVGRPISPGAVFALLALGVVVVLLVLAPRYPRPAMRLPVIVGAPTAALFGTVLWRELRDSSPGEGLLTTVAAERSVVLTACGVLSLVGILSVIGFRFGTLLFLLAAYRFQAGQSWSRTIALSGGTAAAMYLVFELLVQL